MLHWPLSVCVYMHINVFSCVTGIQVKKYNAENDKCIAVETFGVNEESLANVIALLLLLPLVYMK